MRRTPLSPGPEFDSQGRRRYSTLEPSRQPMKRSRKPLTSEQRGARDAVFARADGRCEKCGRSFTEYSPGEFHHILKRRHQKIDDPKLCAALCHTCHVWTEAEPDHAEAAGYLIRGNRITGGTP